jgi:hypothetical protein
MSAGLVAVIVTPGSTAPVLSVTTPLMRPRKSCAAAGVIETSSRGITQASSRGAHVRKGLIIVLLEIWATKRDD